jgi:hypothetical protein
LFTLLSEQTLDNNDSNCSNKSCSNNIKYTIANQENVIDLDKSVDIINNSSSNNESKKSKNLKQIDLNVVDESKGKLIIDKYTQKLKKLQDKLKEPLVSDSNEGQKEQTSSKSQMPSNLKLKYENLYQFKKDVIIKKLLKTIDVMNQELSKLVN